MEDKEADRISALPDSVVQRILSFLPSIKHAIHCSILSKRWRDQWTRLPVLILHPTDMTDERFFKFTENILISYICFKINKFYIKYLPTFKQDPHFRSKIRFATRRNVEDLTLSCNFFGGKYTLPEFLFNYASLVRLRTTNCKFMPNGSVNWEHLKNLSLISCTLPQQTIHIVLLGSPSLEYLVLSSCDGFSQPIIASQSLKILKVTSIGSSFPEILCPSLEELSVMGSIEYVRFSNQAIEKVLSTCRLLNFLKLCKCAGFDEIVIASESLRKLVFRSLKVSTIQISCLNLEELEFLDVDDVGALNLKNVTSSLSAPGDFSVNWRARSVHWRRFSCSMHTSKSKNQLKF